MTTEPNSDEIAWISNPEIGAIDENDRSEPFAMEFHRSRVYGDAIKSHEKCTEDLPVDMHLEQVPSDAEAGVTTMTWLRNLDDYLRRHGSMYTMSRIPVKWDRTVRNIMEADVTNRIAWLEATDDKYDNMNFDKNNKDNPRSLRILVRKSIGTNLRATFDAKPKQTVMVASSNSAIQRTLIQQLEEFALDKEPQLSVEAHANQVVGLCRRIAGTGTAPHNLPLVTARLYFAVPEVSVHTKAPYNTIEEDPFTAKYTRD